MRKYILFLLLPFLLIAEKQSIDLQALGKIVYHFEYGLCKKVVRLSQENEVKYEHRYHYDNDNKLISESLIGGLGEITYSGNTEDGHLVAHTPFGEEEWTAEDTSTFTPSPTQKIYDEQGRLIQKGAHHYFYEDKNLVHVSTNDLNIFFDYDKDGRKIYKKSISKTCEEEEYYLYLGDHEIGSFSNDGSLKWLRIPGMTTHKDLVRAIAIETQDATYAPIYDFCWNIVKLINIEDGTIIETRPDPFGENLATLSGCPWTFCSKRYDPDTNLVDFGYRYYDIHLKEWTSLDPLMQDSNPYRYCFNNPLQFLDPDGRAGFLLPIVTWGGGALTFPLWGPEAIAILAGAGAGYLGHELYKHYQKKKHKKLDHGEDPPYTWDDLGDDSSKCPGEGFEWRGKSDAKDGEGNWIKHKKPKQESLYPDFNHPHHDPHWDYYGPKFPRGVRIYPDRWEHK